MNAKTQLFGGTLPDDEYTFSGNLSDTRELGKLDKRDATSLPPLDFIAKTGPFTGGFRGTKEKSRFQGSYTVQSSMELEVINEQNPDMPADNPELATRKRVFGKDEALKKYPWSWVADDPSGVSKAAVIYSFVNKVTGGIKSGKIPLGTGASGAFGLETGCELLASYIRMHSPDMALNAALDQDLTNGPGYRFSLNENNLTELEPNQEYLLTRYRASFGFSSQVTWGQVFRTDPAMLQSIFPANDALDAAGGPEIFEAAKVGADIDFRLRTNWEAPLELIAYRPDDQNVRIEYRKASRSVSSSSLAFSVSANVMSRDHAKTALSELLHYYSGCAEAKATEIDSKLRGLVGRIDNKLNSIDLVSDLFSGESDALQTAVGKIEDRLAKKWGITANELIRVAGRNKELLVLLSQSSKRLQSGVSIDDLIDPLKQQILQFSDSDLSDSSLEWIKTIRLATGWKGLGASSLSQLLLVGAMRDKVDEALAMADGLKDKKLDLEAFRKQLLEEINTSLTKTELDQNAEKVLEWIREQTNTTPAEIASAFGLQDIIRSVLPNTDSATWDQIMKKVQDFSLSDVLSVDSAEKKLISLLGADLDTFRGKMDTVVDRISSSISKTATASAKFEYKHKRENEALLSFTCSIESEDDKKNLESIYRRLLFGDWEYARESIVSNENRFSDVEFFATEKIETRRSFHLHVLIADFSQQAIDSWQRTVNLTGNVSYEMAASFENEGAWGAGKKRSWSGHQTLYAETPDFIPDADAHGDSFHYRLVSGIAWGGKTKTKGSKINPKPGNWFMLNLLAGLFDEKSTGQNLTNALIKVRKTVDNDATICLGLSLEMGPRALDTLWASAPPNQGLKGKYVKLNDPWVQQYLTLWRQFEKLRRSSKENATTKLTDNELANFNRHCQSLGKMADAARSKENDPKELHDAMKQWRSRSNVTGSAAEKFDKICYFATMVSLLPEDGLDWKLGAALRCGDKQQYFG